MNFEQLDPTGQEKWNTIFDECNKNEKFRNAFITNPQQTLEKVLGEPLKIGQFKLLVNDQAESSTIYINLPPSLDNLELTEEELETVAGGYTDTNVCVITNVTIAVDKLIDKIASLF